MIKYALRFLCILVFTQLLFPVAAQDYDPVTVDQIYKEYKFIPSSVNGLNSMSDGEHYSVLEERKRVMQYDYLTGKDAQLVFDVGQVSEKAFENIDDYVFSEDEKKILLVTNKKSIYRYSYKARHYIFDLRSGTMKPLSENEYEQLATFSPDGTRVAYVFDNNLFIYDLEHEVTIQVTKDGEKNFIKNGASDWVYEEEFGFVQAFCWSPDSKKLAFMRFDETKVKQFTLQKYNGLYPENISYKYPKAGEENSTVTVHIYNLDTGQTLSADTGPETDQYIPRIKWTASSEYLSVIRLNRLQNQVDVLLVNSKNGMTKVLYHEENDCFISEVDDDYIYFTGDEKHFLIRSERSGYFHYYLYSMDGKMVNPVTKGNWEVDQFLGADETKKLLYYTSTEDSPLQRQLYVVGFDGSDKKKLSTESGYVEADFSQTCKYYIQTRSEANNPPVVTVCHADGNQIRVLEDNHELVDDMKNHGFSTKEFIEVPVSDDLMLNAYIIKPPDFDSTKKYPLFVSVYGGPESQDVVDAWDNDLAWHQLLVQHGIVVACIDNRGTDGRGEAFRKATYMQLGKLETEDQIAAVRYLSGKDWIDSGRIGIFGWSYGGYMSLLCMTRGAGLYKMGIAVAPVTNWRFYDTIYTERFMRKPRDNASGYDGNSPIHYAADMSGKLLMVHGTADDNVHLQNSLEMIDQLINADKQIDVFFYPDRNHSIYGSSTRHHLFTKLTDFVLENL